MGAPQCRRRNPCESNCLFGLARQELVWYPMDRCSCIWRRVLFISVLNNSEPNLPITNKYYQIGKVYFQSTNLTNWSKYLRTHSKSKGIPHTQSLEDTPLAVEEKIATYFHEEPKHTKLREYSHDEQVLKSSLNNGTYQTPVVTHTQHWFTTQSEYMYNTHRKGGNPEQTQGEDKLTHNETPTNRGGTPTTIYNNMRQDGTGLMGVPSKTIIPTYKSGDWFGNQNHTQ